VVSGRKPRLKTAPQIIAELEGLRAQNQSFVFIVDDNLIGNKKAIKDVLRHVIDWQRTNGYPLRFVTEASLDLADDAELMGLMAEAHIVAVFVGIESPNEDSLREARKLQNVRAGGMVEKVHRIQNAGMEVWAGMIVGFDNDDENVFEAQRKFLASARINTAMVGMLAAIPRTPLYTRLASAGRLDLSENPAYGTNVIPLKMSRQALTEGYVRLMSSLYEPQAYFERLDDLYLRGKLEFDVCWDRYRGLHPWRTWPRSLRAWLEAFGILARLLIQVPDRSLRSMYFRRMWQCLRLRRSGSVMQVYAIKCAIHFHMHQLVRVLAAGERSMVNTF
jgi:radical SAM superfamily enzyme YgiQ (UPF0313 family)